MKENNWQSRFFYYLVDNVFGHEEGTYLKWYLIFIRFFLMPLDTIYHLLDKRCNNYDVCLDIIKIHGQRYSGRMFRKFCAVGSRLKIVGNSNGYITVRELD